MGSTVDRIKEFIDYKGVSVRKFEESAGFSNGSFASQYKNGKTIGVDKVENILQVYPEINIEWLLTGIGEMITTKSKEKLYKKNVEDNVENDVEILNVKKTSTNENDFVAEVRSEYKNNTPAIVTIDSHNEDNIALVPIPLSAGYLKGYNNPKFISKLPSYRMPGLNNGVFRMFEVQGNSMFPTIPNKSYVVGQFVENWIDDIKDNQVYAVISSDLEDGLIKRCLNKIKKYNNLICKSDNRRNFPTQNINPESIKEIWEIKLHLNFQLPDPADIYDRISDLEGEVYSLKNAVKKLE